jgi:hypothetical protein
MGIDTGCHQPPNGLEEGQGRAVPDEDEFALGVTEEASLAGDFGLLVFLEGGKDGVLG